MNDVIEHLEFEMSDLRDSADLIKHSIKKTEIDLERSKKALNDVLNKLASYQRALHLLNLEKE